MITPQQALVRLIEQREIFYDEMLSLMRQIMSGDVTPTMIAAILVGLRVKKETIGEISAAAFVMREFASKVPVTQRDHLVDTCGTGGDAAHTFNISTASAFVAAAVVDREDHVTVAGEILVKGIGVVIVVHIMPAKQHLAPRTAVKEHYGRAPLPGGPVLREKKLRVDA